MSTISSSNTRSEPTTTGWRELAKLLVISIALTIISINEGLSSLSTGIIVNSALAASYVAFTLARRAAERAEEGNEPTYSWVRLFGVLWLSVMLNALFIVTGTTTLQEAIAFTLTLTVIAGTVLAGYWEYKMRKFSREQHAA